MKAHPNLSHPPILPLLSEIRKQRERIPENEKSARVRMGWFHSVETASTNESVLIPLSLNEAGMIYGPSCRDVSSFCLISFQSERQDLMRLKEHLSTN